MRRKLSVREEQILSLICEGWSGNEIAQMMDLSPHTIQEIKRRLRIKTGCHKATLLVLWAVAHAIIDPRKTICRNSHA